MPITVADFRRHALALPNAIESSHMGHPDFRFSDGHGRTRIFATLSAQDKGCGVLKLTLEQQQAFIADLPAVFEPVQGGWGRMGMTFIHLAAADQSTLHGALFAAYRNVAAKQLKSAPKKSSKVKSTRTSAAKKSSRPKR
jgi:hypothetical protein